jgi:hypothetical protein
MVSSTDFKGTGHIILKHDCMAWRSSVFHHIIAYTKRNGNKQHMASYHQQWHQWSFCTVDFNSH